MRHKHDSKSRIQLKAVPRTTAIKNGKGRRFQVDPETRGILNKDDLIAEFAKVFSVVEAVDRFAETAKDAKRRLEV